MASGPVARNAVRKLLQSSPSFRDLPPYKRREIAHDTARAISWPPPSGASPSIAGSCWRRW